LLHKSYVVVDQDHVKELVDAPEDKISFHTSAKEQVQLKYTFGESLANDDHHAHIIRTKLTRKIGDLMPDMVDELSAAFEEELTVGDGKPAFSRTYRYRVDVGAIIREGTQHSCKA